MLKVSSNTKLNDLKEILKHETKKITLKDLQEFSLYCMEENKYLPEKYKKAYTESVLNVNITRFKSLQNDKKEYEGYLPEEKIQDINELLNKNKNETTYIFNILVIYISYFLKEPIHPPKSIFPGKVKISKKGKDYYCPIKKYHISNDKSVCKYCIAKMVED